MDAAVVRPFWGAPTSYLNFCEEDYVVTRYVAEFINTLSSLSFAAYGIYGLSRIRWDKNVGPRLVSYTGLVGVGVCSASYHMTLKYHTQMSDELSMHLLTTPLLYRLLTFKSNPQRRRFVGVILLTLFTIVMATHMLMDEFLLHATSFALAIYLIATRALKIISGLDCNADAKQNLRNIALFGCLNFGFGYFVWLVDDWACSLLTSARHSVGLPWAIFLEFHGWWHIFTAIGGYIGVAVIDVITSDAAREDPISLMAWPVPLAAKHMSGTAQPVKRD